MNGRLMGRGNRQLMGVDTLWIGENGRPPKCVGIVESM
ncbi:Uncharacterised protein [Pseudomonas putida]|uniref:Uncharacterized protein n=1 Tax=Pseudomonas putida TaxID=303 RepID=A0A6S5ES19_PSEPU|nr:Uncharacterised protein [Pseudomonas putida]SDE04636.1 hypothetical protein SAMN05216185_11569 [Pseudomonas guariconensis]CAB5547999.1 Uncharacterised protein [Pseudomonas putida]CAB5596958.1 Uncharacterised protein [Pseudomonas putida]CAB5605340.1 Uncharacterised protein [Pseudomonas putida]